MRRSLLVLGSLLVTVMACSEPVSPSIPLGPDYDLPAANLTLRGVVEIALDRGSRLELRMGSILVPLRTSESVKAELTAAVGETVIVNGNFVFGGNFQVLRYSIAKE